MNSIQSKYINLSYKTIKNNKKYRKLTNKLKLIITTLSQQCILCEMTFSKLKKL